MKYKSKNKIDYRTVINSREIAVIGLVCALFFGIVTVAAAISGAGMAACIVFGVFVVLGVILVLTVNQRVDYTDNDFTYRDMLRITHRYEYSQVKKIRYGENLIITVGKRLILIDEIELALHPSAIMRLVDFLQKLATEYNLAIYFSSHSIELLRKIKPSNIFHLQKELDNIAIVNPCYPSYATRDIYQHSGYDFLILVEDVLAKYILENIIDENALYKSKLINILPSGGWENVLKMQDDICKSNLAGVGTKVLSVLDGDVKPDFEQLYKQKGLYTNLTINFLPIHSLEKYLHEKIIVNKDADFFKEIGDRFFKVKSLKEVVDSLIKKNDDKAFYNYLIKNLKEQGIEENVFVQKVCEMIYRKEDMSKLLTFLQKTFQN